jgi:hypothetical protein
VAGVPGQEHQQPWSTHEAILSPYTAGSQAPTKSTRAHTRTTPQIPRKKTPCSPNGHRFWSEKRHSSPNKNKYNKNNKNNTKNNKNRNAVWCASFSRHHLSAPASYLVQSWKVFEEPPRGCRPSPKPLLVRIPSPPSPTLLSLTQSIALMSAPASSSSLAIS